MTSHPLMPLAAISAALITAGIALMVFDGARKAKLLEVREGWAHGLRNDLAIIIAGWQMYLRGDKAQPEDATLRDLLTRLYRAKLRLRSGDGHVATFGAVAKELTTKLDTIAAQFASKGSGCSVCSKSPPSLDDLQKEATGAMTKAWEDIVESSKSHKGVHFYIGLILLALGGVGGLTVAIQTFKLLPSS